MREIEVKILDVDRSVVEKKLLAMGANKAFDGEILSVILDRDGELERKGLMLRVRKEDETPVLTLKGPKEEGAAKIREEIETKVGDFEKMLKIFEALGFTEDHGTRKRRISYLLDNVHFEFDDYLDRCSFIPEFLEIEAKDVATIHKYAKRLGFSVEQCTPFSLKDLLERYS